MSHVTLVTTALSLLGTAILFGCSATGAAETSLSSTTTGPSVALSVTTTVGLTTTSAPITTLAPSTTSEGAGQAVVAKYESTVQEYSGRLHIIVDPLWDGKLSREEATSALGELQDFVKKAIADLKQQTVPKKHEPSHALIMAALPHYLSGARDLEDALSLGQLTAAQDAGKELDQANSEMNDWLAIYQAEL